VVPVNVHLFLEQIAHIEALPYSQIEIAFDHLEVIAIAIGLPRRICFLTVEPVVDLPDLRLKAPLFGPWLPEGYAVSMFGDFFSESVSSGG